MRGGIFLTAAAALALAGSRTALFVDGADEEEEEVVDADADVDEGESRCSKESFRAMFGAEPTYELHADEPPVLTVCTHFVFGGACLLACLLA